MEGIKIAPISEAGKKNKNSTWGTPWPKGKLKREESLKVMTKEGEVLSQTRPVAYWPDGSVKWTKTSAFFEKGLQEAYIQKRESCSNEEVKSTSKGINIEENKEFLTIHTSELSCVFHKEGSSVIIKKITDARGQILCEEGKLICLNETEDFVYGRAKVERTFEGKISYIQVEERGPYRVVVRVKGLHASTGSQEMAKMVRNFIPFDLRFYFFAQEKQIKIAHTFLFDGNPQTDFIKGLGISFKRNMQGAQYNRHIRFGGESGLFCESPKLLGVWRITKEDQQKYDSQIRGEEILFEQEKDKKMLELLAEAPLWNDYKIAQQSSSHYLIEKRTCEGYCYIKAATGRRAMGLMYIGDCQSGGMSAYIHDFWEKYPTQLEIKDMASDQATLNLWFYSPDAKAMDLRHYSPGAHPQSEYEGFNEMRATPYGIGNTNEVTLNFFETIPSNEELVSLAHALRAPSLMMADPSYIKSTGVFGTWSLEDRSTKEKAYLEDKLQGMIHYYYQEREQRDWYGFWDYGDIMHTYDTARHTWKYDMGGFAWQNTELMPNMWLWYAFIRSGKEEIYNLARAMTRHNSEVDQYHLGEYKGLGSRHNVTHWGCGCKEARISMAANHRHFYYLTGDERIGDIIDEVVDADFAVGKLDPMRAYHGPDPRFETHIRIGPDVPAFCSNWLAKWERYEDEVAKEKLLKTIAYFTEDKKRFLLSSIYGYNPQKTEYIETDLISGDTHFMFCFGNGYIWSELIDVLEDETFRCCYEELGLLFSDHYPDKEAFFKACGIEDKNYGICMYTTGINAYAAKQRGLDGLAQDIWRVIIEGMEPKSFENYETIEGANYPKGIKYLAGISGNASGQFGTQVIMALALIGDKLPPYSEKYKAKTDLNPWNTNNKLR